MAQTLEQLRVTLAQAVGRLFMGTATGGSTTTLVDTAGLQRYTEDDALKGALLYIAGAGSAAPEGESRRIQGYTATTQTVTVDRAFSATVESSDTYEIYLAPLDLDQWDACINRAIESSWPDIWEYKILESPAGGTAYPISTSSGIHDISAVQIVPGQVHVYWHGRTLARSDWTLEGAPEVDLVLYLLRPVQAWYGATVRIIGRVPYSKLAPTESTDLSGTYLIAASRAEWYGVMADQTRGSADRQSYQRLMVYWTEQAMQAKATLRATLLGLQQAPEEKKNR